MATAYLNATDDVLAITTRPSPPSLIEYQNRIVEATQRILVAPDELVGKLSLGIGGVWTYHRKTSGDGTDISHYTLIEDVSGLITLRKSGVDDTTSALLLAGPLSIADFNADLQVARTIADSGVVLKVSLDAATTKAEVDAITDTRVTGDFMSRKSVLSTATAYTLTDDDFGGPPLLFNAAAAISVSVDTGLVAPYQPCILIAMGTGQITIGGTATVNSSNGLRSRAQYSKILLSYAGTSDSWVLGGDTAA